MTNHIEITFNTWHRAFNLLTIAEHNHISIVNNMPEPNGSLQVTVKGHFADVYNFVTQLNLSFALIANANR